MKRKSIRLTTTSYALLALLEQLGEATSYDIKQALEKSIENFWPVPHTTAYEEPARLAEGGYLSVKQEPGGRRRKVYPSPRRDGGRCGPGPTSPPPLRRSCATKSCSRSSPAPTQTTCCRAAPSGTGPSSRS